MQDVGSAPSRVYPHAYEDEMDDVNQQGEAVVEEDNEHVQGYL